MKEDKAISSEKREKHIAWEEIYRRLESVREALELGWVPPAEEKKAILRARARVLASEPETGAAETEALEVVEFLLAHERYAIELEYVREVYPLRDLTPLPCTPRFVLGIINVRGEVISVIDLKKFFDLPEKGLTDLNKVIILHSQDMEFGILADVILGVSCIAVKEVQPSPATFTGIRERYLKGVTKDRKVVLDAKNLLADRSIVVHEEVT